MDMFMDVRDFRWKIMTSLFLRVHSQERVVDEELRLERKLFVAERISEML